MVTMRWNKIFFHHWFYFWLLLAVTIAITLGVSFADGDIWVSTYFSQENWAIGKQPFFTWLYKYGGHVSILLVGFCILIWGLTYKYDRIVKYKNVCILIVLTTILGSSVLINGILKPYWGRPRPVQIEQFGGPWEYREFYEPGTPAKGQSFPSGHVSIVTIFLVAAFVRNENKKLAVAGVTVGVFLTVSMAVCRIAQGGHFVTDTIWSLCIMMLVAMAIQKGILEKKEVWRTRKLSKVTCVILAIVIALTGFLLVRKPFYETIILPLPDVRYLTITSNQLVDMDVRYEKTPVGKITINSKGAGWLKANVDLKVDFQQAQDAGIYEFRMKPKGKLVYLKNEMMINVPEEKKDQMLISKTTPLDVVK